MLIDAADQRIMERLRKNPDDRLLKAYVLPNGQQIKLALAVAMSVGESMFWRGFTRGNHREVELIHPAPQPARSSGPEKGRHPIPAMNGRPPR